MKTALLALGALVMFSGMPAVAQEAAPKTRAAVRAEAASAVKDGTIDNGEVTKPAAPMKSTKNRAEVRREAAAAEKAGTLVKGEGPGAAASRPNQGSRAAVRAEAASAVKSGQIGKGPDVKK
ncbi:DUF4148 domain-containing protein [Pseudaquabacterium pictum]|uniref:DUF4148 domain-containing protein n=1 Tax=Pseudaquabacterium pictum TaxID=2315236 RepID=A0A480AMX1_9BURK|nr:DUF4148 domain-containing protein [Rubrivivax pictus]GCL61717.1 hypothetical protein AQPW35_07980 [Rubrivivax pictus]